MLLVISANTYAPHCVHFVPPVKNNVIENSLFSRIIYSADSYTMNGLYLRKHTLQQLQTVENDILTAYSSPKIRTAGVCAHYACSSILKISGVWESDTAYGLAYKFIHI
jgi:hypothetical protein